MPESYEALADQMHEEYEAQYDLNYDEIDWSEILGPVPTLTPEEVAELLR